MNYNLLNTELKKFIRFLIKFYKSIEFIESKEVYKSLKTIQDVLSEMSKEITEYAKEKHEFLSKFNELKKYVKDSLRSYNKNSLKKVSALEVLKLVQEIRYKLLEVQYRKDFPLRRHRSRMRVVHYVRRR